MIEGGMTVSFKVEALAGVHDLITDDIRMALFTSAATLTPATTAYSTTNEVTDGDGYTAGGLSLTGKTAVTNGQSGVFDCDDITWPAASFTARAGLLYNASKSNRSIGVVDFNTNRTGTGGDFRLILPPATAGQAFVRFD
jgi:hypothetical protein